MRKATLTDDVLCGRFINRPFEVRFKIIKGATVDVGDLLTIDNTAYEIVEYEIIGNEVISKCKRLIGGNMSDKV